jgi:hypothetical protein
MGPNTTVQQFVERLNELNRYLLLFPKEFPRPLTQDEIIEHEAMILANVKFLMNIGCRSSFIRDTRKPMKSLNTLFGTISSNAGI